MLAAAAVVFSSCKDDDDDKASNEFKVDEVSATIKGAGLLYDATPSEILILTRIYTVTLLDSSVKG